MKYRIAEKEGSCKYWEWNKDEHKMIQCGRPGRVKCSKGFLCDEHLAMAMSSDKKPETPGRTIAEFMELARG